MKVTINQAAATSPTASPTASPSASKSPSRVLSKTSSCLASLAKQASVGGKLAADKKKGRQSNRIFKSGSALFVTSKKNAAFSLDQKASKILFPVPNSPSSSNVKVIVFPKMKKVVVFNRQKDAQLAAKVKLDMKSALKDRTNVENCFSVQSYEPNDQSEAGISLRADNKPNLFGDDLLAATAATSVFRRRQTNFLSARTKNICIIISIALTLLIGLITVIVAIVVLLASTAAIADVSANLTNPMGNFSTVGNTTTASEVGIQGFKSFFRAFRRRMKSRINQTR